MRMMLKKYKNWKKIYIYLKGKIFFNPNCNTNITIPIHSTQHLSINNPHEIGGWTLKTRLIAWLEPVDLDIVQTWCVLKYYHINELSRDQCKINPMKPVKMPCRGLINIAFSNNTHWFIASIHMIGPGARVPCQNLSVYQYEIITRIRPGSLGPWIAFR